MPRVHFSEPVTSQTKGKVPEGRPTFLSFAEVTTLVRELRDSGFDERAVVARRTRFPNGMANHYLMTNPRNWGVVIDLKNNTMQVNGMPYMPIKVMWVREGTISEHWPEDLVLIHSAVSQYGTEMVIKAQINDN